MRGELKEHQKRGKRKIDKHKSQLFYHGLGSGKTLTAIAAKDGDTTVITPASLRTNIKDTADKFGLSSENMKVMSFEGATKKGLSGKTLIIDEAHRLGISKSNRSKKIIPQSKNFEKVILLTGSPIRNHPRELAPLAKALHFGKEVLPMNDSEFNKQFIQEDTEKTSILEKLRGIKGGKLYSMKNRKGLEAAFKDKVDYYAPESTDFPSAMVETVRVGMSKNQLGLYRGFVGKVDPVIAYKVSHNRAMTAVEKSKANSFLNATRMVSNTGDAYGSAEVTPKVMSLVGNIRKHNNKSVVYSNYLDGGLNAVAKELRKKKIKYSIYNGSLKDKEKKSIVDRFNSSKKGTLLISGAGAEGLDLKGVRNMHIMEPHWNDSKIRQVMGRGNRFKSHSHLPKKDRNVKIYKYQSTLPNEKRFFGLFGEKKVMGADEYIQGLADKKEVLNKSFLDVLQDIGSRKER